MLYSKFDVQAFAIPSVAEELDIGQLMARSGVARNFEMKDETPKALRGCGGCVPSPREEC